ncbi:MAG: hypothetical protein JWM16_1662, partial [Verrucomicrobiales bacterium]|nr:hypothetical protein [Verrucomicrobiales bacterium]
MPGFETLIASIVWLVPLLIIGMIILRQMIRILREYERAVVFRLG